MKSLDSEALSVFILTHGRPNNVITYRTLRDYGYTGKIYLIVDNEDKTVDQYISIYGKDSVIVFNKEAYDATSDKADNNPSRKVILFARNACFDIARSLGIEYFVQLDDDYTSFQYRFNSSSAYRPKVARNLDSIFACLLRFYKNTNTVSISMAQGGDFIGGEDCANAISPALKRKCMNSFLCSTSREFQFHGRFNEDVSTYVTLGSRGALFFTYTAVNLNQVQTQKGAGGMTDAYLASGTYVKSFLTVMHHPSSVVVKMLTTKNRRLHHLVKWENTVPCILSETVKKDRGANV